MSPSARVLDAIDETPSDDLLRGLRIAIIAYRLKVGRTRTMPAREIARLRSRAVLMARELLDISTGGIPF